MAEYLNEETINSWINNIENTPNDTLTSQLIFLTQLRNALITEEDSTITQITYNMNSTFNLSIHTPNSVNNLLLISEPHYSSTVPNSPITEDNPFFNNSFFDVDYLSNYNLIGSNYDCINSNYDSMTELALAIASGLY